MPAPGFKIGDAFAFASTHNLVDDAERIRMLPVHPSAGKRAVIQKGYFVELFESKAMMEEFITQHWPLRYSTSGERRRAMYLDKKALNERLLSGEPPDEDVEPSDTEGEEYPGDFAVASQFALEAQLRDFIVANLPRLPPVAGARLVLFRDEQGRDGIEYPTDVGPIDILAIDEHGNFFVFELKLERGPDRALGQLARYMGWVKVHLASDKAVSGVIVARAIDQRLRYAVNVFPNVTLLEYEVSFRLNQVASIGAA